MKKFIAALFLSLCGLCAFAADSPWQELLVLISGHRMQSSFSYELMEGKNKLRGRGDIDYQGGYFRINCGPYQLYNDGQSLWTVNRNDREVVIDKGIPGELFAQPELLLQILGINPSRASYDLQLSGGVLSSFVVKTEDGASIMLKFNGFKLLPESEQDGFQPDEKEFDSSYVITDLR